MDSLVPERMAAHFEAAKSAKLLTVNGTNDAGCGWLVVRLLGDWLRQSAPTPDQAGDTGIVVFSLHHTFEYYASNLASFGIDLKKYEAQGLFRYIGDVYSHILGLGADPAAAAAAAAAAEAPTAEPAQTLEAALELLYDEAAQIRQTYARTVLLLDAPELALPLFDNDAHRPDWWLELMQNAAFHFHHTIVAMTLDAPHADPQAADDQDAVARTHAMQALSAHADMAMMVRSTGDQRNTKYDGTVRVAYRREYEPPRPDVRCREETFVYQLRPDGRSIAILDSYE
ncbi:hypothetical protein SPI_09415 [Niveomyces insectorum RCEF 264]|uniref:Elongator complex protein 6 n=1 Tax=Niveomyces insectorum RCEF 264 TaxID=1081102 RepID=A0A167LTR1_9HYPO|nr:hypothetical protein SPI_09415 [Niveomyces insectorum RCEF 264]